MEVNDELIEALEDMLEEAREGTLLRMLCLYDDGQHNMFSVVVPKDNDDANEMLTALTAAVIECRPGVVSS